MRRYGLIALVALLLVTAAGRDQFDRWVARTALPPLVAETSIEVLDRHGKLLRAYTVADGRWRLNVGLDGVDPAYLDMLIAYEDKRFYSHAGVDPRAVARAVWQALRHGRVVSGGSTLTMQVARLLEDGPTGQWRGKVRQLRVAFALEQRLSKAQILTLYLNRAPFGGNIEGVRAASYAWLGKPPKRLTSAQAALLVALPQSPERRRPDRHPQAANTARDRVLKRLAKSGVLETDLARLEPVTPIRRAFPSDAPHLADRAVLQAPLTDVHHLTLDADLQRALQRVAAQAVQDHDHLSAAIIVADHRSGEVLASVGSAGFSDASRLGFVDMTTALRSPGSTLKPLVYGLAFDDGLAHPETILSDRPSTFGTYTPSNFDGQYRGDITAQRALQLSLNIPVVALTQELGPARLISHMRRAGIEPQLPGDAPAGLAISLGGLGVTLEGLTRLYAAIGNGGRSVPLHWRMGQVPAPLGAPVMGPVAAWYLADILNDTPTPESVQGGRVAFKTGTSYGHRDAWAVGFDGAHVVAVWMGRADGTPVPGAFGGDLAAPVMFQAFAMLEPASLPNPPKNALTVTHAQLPQPLKRFVPREALFAAPSGPKLAFPPDGAALERSDFGVLLKLREGQPPFTVLANGAPILTGLREHHTILPLTMPGFVNLSVIDAQGRAAKAAIELR
ncbi:penicillin-binding protein 1C [Actibacterium atlanticum]|uniref:peptidoglycan glycosyltransferase n=1 Tax=Actibacterium atlanticum TaxID=1461693 RepID=A0A058ZLV6_9RHOB|nr:penicillin-binding protein 1C [Actibacterium atlanticum]KCV82609.1 penicillin-binding protein 1C [Actibacterium atlanticum]